MASDTNAEYVLQIADLPQSVKVGGLALDRLSALPWRLPGSTTPVTNQASVALRQLLSDVVRQECYLESRQVSNLVGELALAIRLDDEQASSWKTNLGLVAQSLFGSEPVPPPEAAGTWSWRKQMAPNLIEFSRVGEWGLLGLAQDHNALLADLAARIRAAGSTNPFLASTTNYWLEAEVDLPRLGTALGHTWSLPAGWPRIALSMFSDGDGVRTRGELTFAKSLGLELGPWNIPTNLVHDPLIGFTATRGITPSLSWVKPWADWKTDPELAQFFCWAQDGSPFLLYAAAPLADASNRVSQLTQYLLTNGNPWLLANSAGLFEAPSNSNGVCWKNLPYTEPFLRAENPGGGEFLFSGLFPVVLTNRPAPPPLLEQVLSRTNLVGYDWELTQPRIEGWLQAGQLFRMLLNRAQLPPGSPAVAWLKAIAPRLGNCTTAVVLVSTNQLAFSRKSSLGFTSAELHLLADWLESPRFPQGVHTFAAPSDNLLHKAPHPADSKPRLSAPGNPSPLAIPNPGKGTTNH
jgi:hypothetical protein